MPHEVRDKASRSGNYHGTNVNGVIGAIGHKLFQASKSGSSMFQIHYVQKFLTTKFLFPRNVLLKQRDQRKTALFQSGSTGHQPECRKC
jgi:hypothetical protein